MDARIRLRLGGEVVAEAAVLNTADLSERWLAERRTLTSWRLGGLLPVPVYDHPRHVLYDEWTITAFEAFIGGGDPGEGRRRIRLMGLPGVIKQVEAALQEEPQPVG
jgi:hypothetical protein